MGKAKSVTTPLWLTLKKAVVDIQLIWDKGAGSLSKDALARAKGASVKSSGYLMGLVALRAYGLIKSGMADLELTPLGKSIVTPTSEREGVEALFNAFKMVEIFKELHLKYKGSYLPDEAYLPNIIHKEFGATEANSKKWKLHFVEAGTFAGVLVSEGNKTRVLSTPDYKSDGDPVNPPSDGETPPPPKTDEKENPVIPKGNVPFPLPQGENRTVTTPKDFNKKDLDYLIVVLGAYIQGRDK